MTPAARLQAAIEIMDQVVLAAREGGAAADTMVARYFSTRRYAGAKDRRAVREFVYASIRRAGEPPASGRAALVGLADERPELAEAFDGSPHGPAPIEAGEPRAPAGVAPAWLIDRLAAAIPPAELPALLERAKLDLRINTLRDDGARTRTAFPDGHGGQLSPDALRLPEGTQVERTEEYRAGLFEIQDEGSQLIAIAAAAAPGMTVIDLCAGAGGKALALAAAMGGPAEGRLIACDVDRGRLSRLEPRAARAGARIETRLLDGGREASQLGDLDGLGDVVLVDAPCSGTGTWRRNPEARWRLTPARIDRLVALQAHVLGLAAPLVRPGGALVYAVCSLLGEEGADQAAGFLAAHPGWRAEALDFGRPTGPGRLLTPAAHGTDGFFVARLVRPC